MTTINIIFGQRFFANALRKFYNSLMLGMCEFNFQMNFEHFICLAIILLTSLYPFTSRHVHRSLNKCFYTHAILRCIFNSISLFNFIKYNTHTSTFKFVWKLFTFSLEMKNSLHTFSMNLAHGKRTHICI